MDRLPRALGIGSRRPGSHRSSRRAGIGWAGGLRRASRPRRA